MCRKWDTVHDVSGVSEALQRVFRRSKVAVAMKPRKTTKELLVHPKDKRSPRNRGSGVLILCKNCDYVYVVETNRKEIWSERKKRI